MALLILFYREPVPVRGATCFLLLFIFSQLSPNMTAWGLVLYLINCHPIKLTAIINQLSYSMPTTTIPRDTWLSGVGGEAAIGLQLRRSGHTVGSGETSWVVAVGRSTEASWVHDSRSSPNSLSPVAPVTPVTPFTPASCPAGPHQAPGGMYIYTRSP